MPIFKEFPPTAGFPLSLKDIFSVFNKETQGATLEEDFRNYLSLPYARMSCSGTAAFYLALETLKKISLKKTVIIPAFLCPLVPLAIKRAGLKVALCDINKNDFNFDLSSLKRLIAQDHDLLAIVAVHLAGIPVDLGEIKRIAGEKEIFIIEDCAQSLGAEYQGKKTGRLGDFSFYSLCRGKGPTIYEGGLISTMHPEFSGLIDAEISLRMKNKPFSEGLKIAQLFGYWVFYRPQLFWFVSGLPQLFWNWRKDQIRAAGEYFSADFPLHRVSDFRKHTGKNNFSRLDDEITKQRNKAAYYIWALKDLAGIKIATESVGDKATYPYLTLLFDQPVKRNQAKVVFKNSGLGVSQIYACALGDYPYLRGIIGDTDCPNARALAQRQITLSTSTFLGDKETDRVIEKIKKL